MIFCSRIRMGRDDFFADETSDKKRKRSNKTPKSIIQQQKDEAYEDEDEGNIEDLNLMADTIMYSDSDAELEREETAAQKRLRLAKKYLDKVENDVYQDDNEVDAAQIDRDLIAERLQVDVVCFFYVLFVHLVRWKPMAEYFTKLPTKYLSPSSIFLLTNIVR